MSNHRFSLSLSFTILIFIFSPFSLAFSSSHSYSSLYSLNFTPLPSTSSKTSSFSYLDTFWPLSSSSTPDLPQSSPFGPRLKASEGFRYDYHRGIDIPTPFGTPVHAIADGTIRLAGNYSSYEDNVVQILHYNDSAKYYSNYMHLSAVNVSENQIVTKGQVIGLSGASVSNFAHLHFEIRDLGLYQSNNTNPWLFLPYTDSISHNASIVDNVPLSDNFWNLTVSLSSLASELDANRVELSVLDDSNKTLETHVIDFIELNHQTINITQLDNPLVGDVVISPAKFNADSDFALWNITFMDVYLPQSAHILRTRSFDVHGNAVTNDLVISSPKTDTEHFSGDIITIGSGIALLIGFVAVFIYRKFQ
jgi:murein DD-endopeptidase MepM/ murein hydrolase activator NlpD